MGFWDNFERRYARLSDDLPDLVEAVIAIGIDVSGDGRSASPQSIAVAEKAVQIFFDQNASKLILTGGYYKEGSDPRNTEAQLMYWDVVAKDSRIRQENVILETNSYRTFMNADNVLPILRQYRLRRVVVVAQQWHSRRVAATFSRRWAGNEIMFYVINARSPYGRGSQKRLNNFFYFFLWDTLAFIVSKLKGYA